MRGTVRDPDNEGKTAHLRQLAKDQPGTLELVAADLLKEGSFDAAIDGCELVVHSASTVRLTAKDPQRDIIDVAVKGTTNVLGSVAKVGNVKRVVLTSSIAAVVDDSLPHDYRFSEDDWNESATIETSPYPLSKTLAERKAWELAEEGKFDLVALNPTFVMGPVYIKDHRRSSPAFIRSLLKGIPPVIPRFHFGIVDVRDVADAHAEALYRSDASGRHILNNRGAWLADIVEVLRPDYGKYKLPKRMAPDIAMYVLALFDKRLSWSYLRTNLGVARRLDNRRSIERLGIEYRPFADSVTDTAASLIAGGFL